LTNSATDMLESNRKRAIETIMGDMLLMVHQLEGVPEATVCHARNKMCYASMLGTLKRSAVKARLWPFSSEGYVNSLRVLAARIRRVIDIRSLCDLPEPGIRKHSDYVSHGFLESMERTLKSIENRPEFTHGLNLDDFEAEQ
jgi:hypothetical protein